MKIATLSTVMILFTSVTLSQSVIYGIRIDPGSTIYNFVSLDPTTGIETIIQPIPNMTGSYAQNSTTFNPNNNHYYTMGLTGSTSRLFTIDASTGTVLQSPAITTPITGLLYSCSDSSIYALANATGGYRLSKVNSVTGTITPVSNLIAVLPVYDSFTIDQVQGLYIFTVLASPHQIYAYKIPSGQLVYNHNVSLAYIGHKYSCNDSTLYVLQKADSLTYNMRRLNISTGIFYYINTLPGIKPGYSIETFTLDEYGNYIFRGYDSNANSSIITIDPALGNIISIIPSTTKTRGFQHGICCYDSTFSTGISNISNTDKLLVFPNPVNDILNIKSDKKVDTVFIYNSEGRLVLRDNINSRLEFSVNFYEMKTGLYILKVIYEDGNYVSRKVEHW